MNVQELAADAASEKPSVSVVLIVRDGARFIASAIESVLRGTMQPDEILVIDGQSQDDTVAIASAFPLVRVREQAMPGIAAAYNQGVQESSGDLIAFISHDDLWSEHKLELQLQFLRDHPAVWGCVGHIRHFLDAHSSIPAGFRQSLLDESVIGYVMESVIVRRGIFDRVGYMNQAFGPAGDTDWFSRARDAGCEIALLPDTVVLKRVHDTNTSISDGQLNNHLLRALRGSIARKRSTTQHASDHTAQSEPA
ncbi:MAG: glycosyltransferase family 2 protein [Gemmatimonas sp.]